MAQVRRLAAEGLRILLVEQAVDASFAVADYDTVLDMGRLGLVTPADDMDDVAVLQDAYFGRRRQHGPH
jgi:branched-chain amino acid transport system ATP-binding protein